MAVITRTNFSKALYPGVSDWFGRAYEEHPQEWSALFDSSSSRRAYEEDVQLTGMGLARVKTEGGAIEYDEERQGFITRYSHVVYGLGFVITREMWEDDLYDVIGKQRSEALAFSMRQTKEIVAANVYNRAFNSSYTGGDGVSILNTAHPRFGSNGTWSNKPSTDVDLSEAALEQACIDIMKFTDDYGLKISVMPRTLHIPVDLIFEAERILKGQFRQGTSDNDINVLYKMGKFQDIVPNHYFTSTSAWFIRTNVPNGMKHFQRRGLEFTDDSDFDTENAKFKATERYSFGNTDPRALYGSSGA